MWKKYTIDKCLRLFANAHNTLNIEVNNNEIDDTITNSHSSEITHPYKTIISVVISILLAINE